MRTRIHRFAGLASALLLLAGCSQDRAESTSPLTASATSSADRSSGGSKLKIAVVKRDHPLNKDDLRTAKTIGPEGGFLYLQEAGALLVVPRGAVSAPVLFSMTANSGSALGYEFEPHGTTFAVPLIFRQSLVGTSATLATASTLNLGYVTDPSLIGISEAVISQLLGGVVDPWSWSFTTLIPHFSGYVMTCGRGSAFNE